MTPLSFVSAPDRRFSSNRILMEEKRIEENVDLLCSQRRKSYVDQIAIRLKGYLT